MGKNPPPSTAFERQGSGAANSGESYGFDLLKYTLESVRNDTTVSRDMQQKIIQAFATVFASILLGGLVYASQTTIQQNGLVIVLLFNLAAPTFGGIASVIFMGELVRQGRAAALHRGLEK